MADYIPLSDFAAKLGVSEETIQDLRERGKLRAFRDGSSWKFKEDDLDKARSIMAEEGIGISDAGSSDSESQEFELSGISDPEEGSSGSMDSLLISDVGDGDAGSSNIIGDDSDSSLNLDSDIGLGDSSSSIDPAAESNLSSLSLGEGSDILEGSSINKPVDEDEFSLADDDDEELSLVDDGSDANIDLGSEPSDPEGTGSGLSLGLEDDSLDLGTSGIGLEDNDSSGELTLDIEDDEDSSMDLLVSESDLGLADDEVSADDGSEINLIDDDSGVGLAADSADDSEFSLSSGDSGLELISADDAEEVAVAASAGDDDDGIEALGGGAEADFMLTPIEGDLEDDDSGSQVIALDSDSMSSESGLFGSSTLEGGDFGGLGDAGDGLEADEPAMAGTSSRAAAPVAAAPAEVPYSLMNVLSLGLTAVLMIGCGLMVTDLMWNMWSYNEPYALSSTLMDGVLSMLP
ncbi:helix-turn-helix domain-containing protein [Bremerella sp. JC817]|uniref:helix-turn-helix domain-containing protein n=1 Tax=Bremerella sp. JC817 TaxID=3231756 RepID=UPI003458F3DD